jgi:hypothetical protein
VHDTIGTVQVTALGMFGRGGFAIAAPTLASLAVMVGGISASPVEIDGHVETLDLLDRAATIDHNVVDGAPATRFAADLSQVMQRAAILPSGHPNWRRERTTIRAATATATQQKGRGLSALSAGAGAADS